MNIISSDNMFDDNEANWKVGSAFLFLLILLFILDIGNISFLMSPMHFSFIPLMLFIGSIKFNWLVTPLLGFMLGFATDILSYTPIGLMTLVYFLTVFICRWQNRFILAQPFHIIWLFFAGYLSLYCAVEWIIQSIYHRYIFDVYIEFYIFVYGVIFFPVLWLLLFKLVNINSSSQKNI